jgi:hypothetical protein
MPSRLRQILARLKESSSNFSLRFDRPLVLFQSDDWGRVGVRDREGWEELLAAGIKLGEKPYDFYSLETADDVEALSEVLRRHRDSVGRHPSIGTNFITANVDFSHRPESGLREIPLRSLADGLPDAWRRPMLREAYQQGLHERLFFPALHGLTHFCAQSVIREFETDGERRQLLQVLWRAGTPYIHWRMPWIGYEYWDPSQPPEQRFLPLASQRVAIQRAAEIYRGMFATIPLSACAPGYRANQDTKTAWFEAGVRVVQGGPKATPRPFLDANGMLVTFRSVEIEPATQACELDGIIRQAEDCFARGMPAIVSMHSINFHSTLKDFRTPTLTILNNFLTAIETKWPDVLYVHDGDLFDIATNGLLAGEAEKIKVGVTSTGANR